MAAPTRKTRRKPSSPAAARAFPTGRHKKMSGPRKGKDAAASGRSARTPRAQSSPPPDKPAGAAAMDNIEITALGLDPGPLNPAMEAYFKKCEEK